MYESLVLLGKNAKLFLLLFAKQVHVKSDAVTLHITALLHSNQNIKDILSLADDRFIYQRLKGQQWSQFALQTPLMSAINALYKD